MYLLKKIAIFVILCIFTGCIASPTLAQEATISAQKPIAYELSYPGLLPDHPLYPIKAFRDRIQGYFTSDPMKKAEFNLLQADKRVQASLLLMEKGPEKIDLAESTLSKAENYFEDALIKAREAKNRKIDVKDFAQKMILANQKHQEVFQKILNIVNTSDREKFSEEANRLKELEKRAKELKG